MAVQYYKILGTGKVYALDKNTGSAQEVASAPSGAGVITWSGASLPSELQTALQASLAPARTATIAPSPISIQTPTPEPVFSSIPQTPIQSSISVPLSSPSPSNVAGVKASPTVNLKPGDTGANVKKLQDYLVSKGFMTQAQVNTGYGTYGPKTTAAVAALQKSLGVDNSTGVGYFGPRTIAAIRSTDNSNNIGTTTTPSGTSDPGLLKILNNPTLLPDQKAVIQSIFNATVSNDADTAARLQAALKAASEFSDPYFKAQIRLVTDALQRGISGKEGDLAFAESQQRAALDELRANTAAAKDQLSFQHAQELKQLETKYVTDLQTTQDNLAASGFTSSSKRARSEQILNEQNQGLVESSNKNFAYDLGNRDRTLASNEASTQAQIANLRRLSAEGKLDLLRNTEQKIGSENLASLGYANLLGNVGGDIKRQQATDALSFANSFVF